MSEDEETEVVTPVCEWEFASHGCGRWGEVAARKIDKTRSWVQFDDVDYGERITIITNCTPQMMIESYRDQWGTYITFNIDEKQFTVAQEDGTESFMDALMSALTKFKNLTDIQTMPAILIDKSPAK